MSYFPPWGSVPPKKSTLVEDRNVGWLTPRLINGEEDCNL
jgi:hypothetical protein